MYDIAVIGGGIVGLSVGFHLLERRPGMKVVILEKEREVARHQTGHNSGVIHSGIYYKPGSLKARFAREGSRRLVDFCRRHEIPYQICGKVIVAVEEDELPLLEKLFRRGLENGLSLEKLTPEKITEVEPHVRGVAGIWVPDTGIVDFRAVARVIAREIQSRGGELRLRTEVRDVRIHPDRVELETNREAVAARGAVNCAGLFSDRIAALAGEKMEMKIVPFRGEYYHLQAAKTHLVKHLVYPVPHPDFPFLGVHFTRMIDGSVHIGPNAVLSLKREGYRKTDVSPRDAWEVLTNPAFWKVATAHFQEGFQEVLRSFSKRLFVRHLQKYIPEIEEKDLIPAPAGVRAQALLKDGRLLDDFFILRGNRMIHVGNAPSPAATASLEIGRHIAGLIHT